MKSSISNKRLPWTCLTHNSPGHFDLVEPVPYVDIAKQHAPLKAELLRAISEVIDEGQFILGRTVAQFEKEFADLCGVRFAVAVNSGTDALILALKALGVGPGDEVITVPNSFIATTTCVRVVGARPVFVDVAEDYNIDPGLISEVINPRTKAILPVHLTGRPCEMAPIMELAQGRGLFVIEDCAQAVAAEYRGQQVGSFGDLGCFSLHPLKTLNACGDGGVLTTSRPDLYERLMIMRNLGLKNRDECIMWSTNSRLDSLQAAILLVKMKYLASWTERRREHARRYQHKLANVQEVRVPQERDGVKSVYHAFVIEADRRDELKTFLTRRGIGSAARWQRDRTSPTLTGATRLSETLPTTGR